MKTTSFSNVDRALVENLESRKNPSREHLQKMLDKHLPENHEKWEKDLEWAKNYEKRLVDCHKMAQFNIKMDLLTRRNLPNRYRPEKHAQHLNLYKSRINHIFRNMHHIVDIEGILNTANPEIVDEETH